MCASVCSAHHSQAGATGCGCCAGSHRGTVPPQNALWPRMKVPNRSHQSLASIMEGSSSVCSQALPASEALSVSPGEALKAHALRWMSFCSVGGRKRSSGAGNPSPISSQCKLAEAGCGPCPRLKGQSLHLCKDLLFKRVLSSGFQQKSPRTGAGGPGEL